MLQAYEGRDCAVLFAAFVGNNTNCPLRPSSIFRSQPHLFVSDTYFRSYEGPGKVKLDLPGRKEVR
jgi:hypothetical protein